MCLVAGTSNHNRSCSNKHTANNNTGRVGLGLSHGWGGVFWSWGTVYDACSDCVVIVVLGDLVAWRHFVRGLEGAAQLFIIKLSMWMDSMMCFTIVFIFDAELLLMFWNVWFSRFCFSFFCGFRRSMYVLEHRPQNVQGRLDYWNL